MILSRKSVPPAILKQTVNTLVKINIIYEDILFIFIYIDDIFNIIAKRQIKIINGYRKIYFH